MVLPYLSFMVVTVLPRASVAVEVQIPELSYFSVKVCLPALGSTIAVWRPNPSYSKVVVTLPGAVIALGCPSGRNV